MPHGKICYVEIPATDAGASARFYSTVFGWAVRTRGDGSIAFDDATGAVSGTWVTGRTPRSDEGVLVYVMVDAIVEALSKAVDGGGQIVTPRTPIGDSGAYYATMLDLVGNLVGLYEEMRLA